MVLKPELPLFAAVAAATAANPAAATASSTLREFFIRDSPFSPLNVNVGWGPTTLPRNPSQSGNLGSGSPRVNGEALTRARNRSSMHFAVAVLGGPATRGDIQLSIIELQFPGRCGVASLVRFRFVALLSAIAVLLVLAAPAAGKLTAAASNSAAAKEKAPTDNAVFFASDGMRQDLVAKYAGQGVMPTMRSSSRRAPPRPATAS